MKKFIFTLVCLASQLLVGAQLLYGVGGHIFNRKGEIFSFSPVTKTYTKYKEFNGEDGDDPRGGLVLATDGKFYGMTLSGGAHDLGVIFSFDPTTKVFSKRRDFNPEGGGNIQGNSLMQASNGKLYGMTNTGGVHNSGVLFSFDPATDAYTKLKDFNKAGGQYPLGGKLAQATDGKLYGMTSQGGSHDAGVIFSFDPATAIYAKLKDFSGADGRYPVGSVIQAQNGNLYGMTNGGGSKGAGVIFSFEPETKTYTKLKDFAFDNNDGRAPLGNLLQATDGKLYGMTHFGGNGGRGTLFSFDPATNTFAKLMDFNFGGADGYDPSGSLVQAKDGKLYGIADQGGIDQNLDAGTLFSFDPVTNTFAKLLDFGLENSASTSFGFLTELICNGTTYYRDADGDGYGDPAFPACFSTPTTGYVANGTDCNDSIAAVHPGAVEICNGIDDNCDGVVDEGCTPSLVDSFVLVNASADKDISAIHDGDVLNLTQLPRVQLNIRAATSTAHIGSVVFELNGQQTRKHVENGAPYALFKNIEGNYFGGALEQGDYTLIATPYSEAGGKGTKGTPRIIHFTVVYFATIADLVLVSAPNGNIISSDPNGGDAPGIYNGQVINLATLPTTKLNIEVYDYSYLLGSVVFDLNGPQSHHQVENASPYTVFGGSRRSYNVWTPVPGTYTLTATPYSAPNGKGTKGKSYTVHFTVVNAPPAVTSIGGNKRKPILEREGQIYKILTASPNPFTSQSTVRFSVPASGQATLSVYNATGVEVARLYNGKAEAKREYSVFFDGKQLPAGAYLLRLTTDRQLSTLKVVLTH